MVDPVYPGQAGIKVEFCVVPTGILKRDVLEDARRQRRRLRDHVTDPESPVQLTAAHQAGINLLLGPRIDRRAIDAPDQVGLRGGQAVWAVGAPALQCLRIEVAASPNLEDSVLDSIPSVADL